VIRNVTDAVGLEPAKIELVDICTLGLLSANLVVWMRFNSILNSVMFKIGTEWRNYREKPVKMTVLRP
jgi:hypothetical protein